MRPSHHLVIRTRSRLRKRLPLIFLGLAVAVALVLILRPRRWFGRPDLQLVALDADGLFQDSVELPRAWADTTYRGAYGATARVALVLGVRNVGDLEATPRAVNLSLPARYRLETSEGRELPHETSPGNPLIRYVLNGPFPAVQPGRLPTVLTSTDTLWLEPIVPELYCIAVGDSVPELIPAAQPDARLLSRLAIFYSFDTGARRGRQAGLLSLRLDPSLVERPSVPAPPIFPTSVREPAWPMPQLGDLSRVTTVSARCGPPEAPMEITSTIWQGASGGRVYVLAYGGKPRKYLFDLNGDGTIELEMWDAAGTGHFDAARNARFALPAFLGPPPGPPPFNPAIFADLPADSLARLRVFADAGPYRPAATTAGMPGGPFRGGGLYAPRGPHAPARATGFIRAGGAVAPAPAPAGAGAPAPTPAPADVTTPATPSPQAAPPAESAAGSHGARGPGTHLLGRPVPLPNQP
jgi:hypothetical protein